MESTTLFLNQVLDDQMCPDVQAQPQIWRQAPTGGLRITITKGSTNEHKVEEDTPTGTETKLYNKTQAKYMKEERKNE